DAVAMIGAAEELPEHTRRHWPTSLRKIAQALDKPLEVIPARYSAVRNELMQGPGVEQQCRENSGLAAAPAHRAPDQDRRRNQMEGVPRRSSGERRSISRESPTNPKEP